MAGHDIIVIGASAGGVEALTTLCAALPADLPASLFVAQHVAPTARSVLPALLNRAGPLPAAAAVDGETVRPGRIYVAPPDQHLLLAPGRVLLRRGPHENRTRPAADPLFRSAAVAYGARVVGAVLTGMLDDGAAGLLAIRRCGGVTMVQDPAEAQWPDMPRNAMRGGGAEHCLGLRAMAAMLRELARRPAGASPPVPPEVAIEARIAQGGLDAMPEGETVGAPSRLGCPHCGGVLNEVRDGEGVRFRCQVGHAYGAESLADAQSEELERALAVATRTHRDRVALFRRMEAVARERGFAASAERWRAAAEDGDRAAALITGAMLALRARADEAG